jgi:hypothetical protein
LAKAKLPAAPPILSEEELDALAREVAMGHVFITNTEEGLRYSFGVLMAAWEPTDEFVKHVGAVYEEMSKAMPGSINGFPMFFSCKILHLDQFDALRAKVELFQQRMTEPLEVPDGGD